MPTLTYPVHPHCGFRSGGEQFRGAVGADADDRGRGRLGPVAGVTCANRPLAVEWFSFEMIYRKSVELYRPLNGTDKRPVRNPAGIGGFRFVELLARRMRVYEKVLEPVFEAMGLARVAQHRSKDVHLWRQGAASI